MGRDGVLVLVLGEWKGRGGVGFYGLEFVRSREGGAGGGLESGGGVKGLLGVVGGSYTYRKLKLSEGDGMVGWRG